jgi:calpain-15
LAEYPKRIQRLFETDTINKAGCYAVNLWINGTKLTVVVDDRFPFDTRKNRWAFSRTKGNSASRAEIWVLLLEKAWAKVFGSYGRIEGGFSAVSLRGLTGTPAKAYIHDEMSNKDDFWALIQFSD